MTFTSAAGGGEKGRWEDSEGERGEEREKERERGEVGEKRSEGEREQKREREGGREGSKHCEDNSLYKTQQNTALVVYTACPYKAVGQLIHNTRHALSGAWQPTRGYM